MRVPGGPQPGLLPPRRRPRAGRLPLPPAAPRRPRRPSAAESPAHGPGRGAGTASGGGRRAGTAGGQIAADKPGAGWRRSAGNLGEGRLRAGGEAAPVTAPGGLGSAQASLPRRAAPQGLGSSGPWPWVCLEGGRLSGWPWAGQELPGQPWGAGLPERGHVHPEKPQGPCFFLPLSHEGAWECSGTGLGRAVVGGRSGFISPHLPGTAGAHVREGEGGVQRAASHPGGTGQ